MELPQFQPYRAAEHDIERAKNLGPTDCPRRYCRFWRERDFAWNLTVREGCCFAELRGSQYTQRWFPRADRDCCRLDSSSPVDHYDTRTMALLNDGFPPDHPLRVHHEPELYTYPRPIESYRMSPEDIERAAQLQVTDCPRRYCWWWRWLSFQWDVPLEQGCDRHESERGETPCCRREPASTVDHYEPREPHLMEDGFEVDRFDRPAG